MPSEEAREIGHVCDFTVIPGVIHGLRQWSIYSEGSRLRLGSLNPSFIWPLDEIVDAACRRRNCFEEEPEEHDPPGAGCSCGVYAFHPSGREGQALAESVVAPEGPGGPDGEGWPAYGVISAWGRIEVHEEGFRAQHATPVALLIGKDWHDSEWGAAIDALGREYGLAVVEIDDPTEVEQVCAERWPGLTDELVTELLVGELEVVLEPATTSLILRDDQPIAGNGLAFAGHRYRPWFWDPEWLIDERGLRVVRVAGTSHTRDTIQGDEFAPGRAVRLVRDVSDEDDPWAVAIYDEAGVVKAGCVPRRVSGEVCRDFEERRLGEAFVAWQWRDLRTGERIGLCVLIPRRGLEITIVDEPQRRTPAPVR